jgi:hypothetical protein
MLSPLKPLLCRHDYYWSERHRSDRCRRCGKTRMVEAGAEPDVGSDPAITQPFLDDPWVPRSAERGFLDIAAAPPADLRPLPSAKVLRAQARDRRETLLALLDQLAKGREPSRQQTIDTVLAVIEDAHSADPVLFGSDAAAHFARLHQARSAPEA